MTDGPLLWLVFRNSLKCTPKQKTNTASGALSPALLLPWLLQLKPIPWLSIGLKSRFFFPASVRNPLRTGMIEQATHTWHNAATSCGGRVKIPTLTSPAYLPYTWTLCTWHKKVKISGVCIASKAWIKSHCTLKYCSAIRNTEYLYSCYTIVVHSHPCRQPLDRWPSVNVKLRS